MKRLETLKQLGLVLALVGAISLTGCRIHMPHAPCTWPAGGDIQQTHAKPPEGGYYSNWDPYAVELVVQPVKDVNPVRTQHVLVATVKDGDGEPLPNRRVEWIIAEGSVGDIVEVDESGWRASRGYKVDNHYAVSHTNNSAHVLDMGNDDPADDIHLETGQSWCVITSPIEGDTYITVYAPGIYDWSKHKVFVTKHWYDLAWEFPPPATNPIGTTHELATMVMKYSDHTPLAGYTVNYRIVDGPPGTLEPGGGQTASVKTDDSGLAKVTLKQTKPLEGTNNIAIEIIRPENECDCTPAVQVATGLTSKTWIGPKIAITKTAPAREMVGRQFSYPIEVSNPSDVNATNVVVTDVLPTGIAYVSSTPAAKVQGQSLTWSLGTLPARGAKRITVQVKATRTGTFENCADVRADRGLSGRDCATTVIAAPKLVLEKECSSEVLVCDPIDYRIIVRNTGDGPAMNVKVTDRLPAGLTTTDGKTSVSSAVGTLEPGQARQIRFQAKANKTGTFENKATASADGGLTAEATCTTVVRQPVLEVTKTGPELRYVGRPAIYEITVANKGDASARETMLVDTIPAGTEFVSASDRGQFANGKVTWSLGTLAVNGTKTVTLTLKPLRIGVVRNLASAKAVCAEASDDASTQIKGMSAILLEVIDVEDPIEIGANETYVITVTNQGSADGTNIVIECIIPPEEDYVSSTGLTRAAVDGKVVKFAPLKSLAPKAKATYQVVVKGTDAADVRFKVKLTSDQIERPVEETESTHVY
jgi:uncharacterized repeat protein (TIGR01451 family)